MAPQKKKKRQSWLDIGLFFLSCVLAAIVLLGLILAGYYGYIVIPQTEFLLAGILGIFFVGGIISFGVKKMKSGKKKQTEEESDILRAEVHKQEIVPQEICQPEIHQREILQPKKTEEKKEVRQKSLEKKSFPKSFTEKAKDTVLLSQEPSRGPASFVSRDPGELETIYLKNDLVILGKLETAADVVIPLDTVSRLHAKVRRVGEDYFLTDLNSRNGTSVNGRLLQAEEAYQLQDEDEVDFAQAKYVFLK